MLPGRFMAINQAMGTPRSRDAGAAYVHAFVDRRLRMREFQRVLEIGDQIAGVFDPYRKTQ